MKRHICHCPDEAIARPDYRRRCCTRYIVPRGERNEKAQIMLHSTTNVMKHYSIIIQRLPRLACPERPFFRRLAVPRQSHAAYSDF